MSRIEEALKKAAVARYRPGISAVEERRAHVVDPSMLERYAREEPPSESVTPLPAPPPARRDVPRTVAPVDKSLPESVTVPAGSKLVVGSQVASGTVEQYRRLAAVLQELQSVHSVKTIMVSSSLPREGKTLTVANLALTLAESYDRRVLLIDADFRRPSVHEVFGVSNTKGLGEILRANEQQLPIVNLSRNLGVVTAGRPDANPTAQLTSPLLQSLVKQASARYDWVLLDTPPIGLLTDAQLVARLSDGVLFVIGAGTTPLQLVRRCIAEIGAERIVGTVLNRATEKLHAADGYYHGYFREAESQLS